MSISSYMDGKRQISRMEIIVLGFMYMIFAAMYLAFIIIEAYYVHLAYGIGPIEIITTHLMDLDFVSIFFMINIFLAAPIGIILLARKRITHRTFKALFILASGVFSLSILALIYSIKLLVEGRGIPIGGVVYFLLQTFMYYLVNNIRHQIVDA